MAFPSTRELAACLKGVLTVSLYIIIMIGAASCSGGDHDHDHEGDHHDKGEHHHEAGDHDHDEDNHEDPNIVFFSKEQSATVDFATAKVAKKPFGEVLRTVALVEPSNGDERVVVAKASGIVHLSGDKVVVGKPVSAGESLFTVNASAMADNNLSVRLKEAESVWNLAKKEYERKQELVKDKIVSEAEFQAAKAEYEKAGAAYEALRGGFSGGTSGGSAPIGGFVKSVYVKNGEYVEAGSPVVAITQNRNMYLRAEVSPRRGAALKNISGATLKSPADGEVYTLADLNGSVVSAGKVTGEGNPMVPLVFEISNTIDLVLGTFVEMYITSGETPALTVPVGAIVEEMGNYFVFVEKSPEHYEKREVKIGKSNGKEIEIKSGLTEGETVVSKGAVLVKLAQASGKLDAHAGHVH